MLKPDPAMYRLALKRLAASPQSTLLIGDLRVNLDAARELGLRTVLIRRDARAAAESGGHPTISSLAELGPLLDRAQAP